MKTHQRKIPPYDIIFKNFVTAERSAISKHIKTDLIAKDETSWTKMFAKDFRRNWDKSVCKICKHEKCRHKIKEQCDHFLQDDDLMQIYKKLEKRSGTNNPKNHKRTGPSRKAIGPNSRDIA